MGWFFFPQLFFWNSHNVYITGLDPTYMSLYDLELYELWRAIGGGRLERPSQAIRERLGAEYVADDNSRRTPVMLHRAILGSFERFIGILIEHYAGAMPVWLAPVQAVVLNISERQAAYAEQVAEALRKAGLRAEADLRNEKISYKIREHSLQKLPYQVVVGDQEMAANQVAVRTRGGEDLGRMALEAFIARLKAEAARLGRAA